MSSGTPASSPPAVCGSNSSGAQRVRERGFAVADRRGAGAGSPAAARTGMPAATVSAAPSSSGNAASSISASIPAARVISTRWPDEAEAGDVGAGGCAVGDAGSAPRRARRRCIDASAASIQRPRAAEPRVRGEQRAGAQRLGQDQRLARLQAVLAQDARKALVDQPVHGEAQRELAALAGVAADQRAAGLVEHRDGAAHQLEQRRPRLRARGPGARSRSPVAVCGSAPMA